MALWVTRRAFRLRIRRVGGYLKDRISMGRVRSRGNRQMTGLHVALISATSHEEAPASEELVGLLLQAFTGSRMRVSQCISLLMERLNKTKSWIVALKCLTLIHKALHHGCFTFQDQLSIYPKRGGRNYLNLSRFRDTTSPFAWEASSWIRWYARFLEALMEASRTLGTFLDSTSQLTPSEKLSSLQNDGLMAKIMVLNTLLHEICGCPLKSTAATGNRLIKDALRLVVLDSLMTQDELRIHLKEICQRLRDLSTSDISELLRVCEQLATDSMALVHLVELALALNLLQSHQCPDRILFTDYELMNIKAALKTPQVPLAVAAPTAQVKKDPSNGSFFHLKLSPLVSWKGSQSLQRRVQVGTCTDSLQRRVQVGTCTDS